MKGKSKKKTIQNFQCFNSKEKSVKIGEIKNFLGAEILSLQTEKMIVHEISTQRKKYFFNFLKIYAGCSFLFMYYALFFKMDNYKMPLRS